jgi:cellulose synthase/poly-beta-1,6-N-acetylglucosamine synthase-like glycosyltransferase
MSALPINWPSTCWRCVCVSKTCHTSRHWSVTPRVALLYTTYNDLIPEAVSQLQRQSYPACDLFILDDSTEPDYRAQVERCGARVVRRETRQGNKAGNLNNWLRQYGHLYDYVVVADNDSLLPADFVARMVAYGEHPGNHQVAMFQSKILNWNHDTRLARILADLCLFAIMPSTSWPIIVTRSCRGGTTI